MGDIDSKMNVPHVSYDYIPSNGDISWHAACAAVELGHLIKSPDIQHSTDSIAKLSHDLAYITEIPEKPYSPSFLTNPTREAALQYAIKKAGIRDDFNTATEILQQGSKIADDLKKSSERNPGIINKREEYLTQLQRFCGSLSDELIVFE